MSERAEYMRQREDLLLRRRNIETEVRSHRDSIRAALPLAGDAQDIEGEYVMRLAITMNERLAALRGVNRKIAILERELGL